MAKKEVTKCPVSLAQFLENAKPILVNVGGAKFSMDVKEFSTGSFGWYCTDKLTVSLPVGDEEVPVRVQVGLQLTVIGSKKESSREE